MGIQKWVTVVNDRKYKSKAVKVLEDGKTIRLTDVVYVSKLDGDLSIGVSVDYSLYRGLI